MNFENDPLQKWPFKDNLKLLTFTKINIMKVLKLNWRPFLITVIGGISFKVLSFLIKVHFIGRVTSSSFSCAFGLNDQVFSNTLLTEI